MEHYSKGLPWYSEVVTLLTTGMVVVLAVHTPRVARAAEPEEAPAARRLIAIELLVEPRGLVVTLVGDGRLRPSSVYDAERWPPRIVIDLPEVAALVPSITSVGVGPVSDIRVSAQSLDPLLTRVVFQLTEQSDCQIDDRMNTIGQLRLVFPLGPAAGVGPSVSDPGTARAILPHP